jgi:hypothetical protein
VRCMKKPAAVVACVGALASDLLLHCALYLHRPICTLTRCNVANGVLQSTNAVQSPALPSKSNHRPGARAITRITTANHVVVRNGQWPGHLVLTHVALPDYLFQGLGNPPSAINDVALPLWYPAPSP